VISRRRIIVVGVVVALLVAVAMALGWVRGELSTPRADWPGEAVVVELESGLSANAMLAILAEHGVVRSPRLLEWWLRWTGGADTLHAGEYRFDRPVSPLEVLDTLRVGAVLLHPVTLPEGLTMRGTAQRLEDAGFGPVSDHLAVFADPGPIRDLDPDARDLEGYLFPDTYHFPRDETPEGIARAMVSRFREVVGADYGGQADRVSLGFRDAVTLASLIEKETSLPDERWKISRVFHNRLTRGWKLQCDPTVIYAITRDGGEVGRLTTRDLEYDSPWNTYRYGGLPPGPICSPGRESLEAAVGPAEGTELYFVASPEGGHRFSTDLEAHLRAVREWRAYSRSSR
jgi:UPF0755 protein